MTAREEKRYEIEYSLYLIAEYGPLCRAAGYDTAALKGIDVYDLATKIMGAVKSLTPYVVNGTFGGRDYISTVKAMSAAEKQQMCERLAGRK